MRRPIARSSLLQNQPQRAAHLLAFSARFVLSSWARDGLVCVWSSWYVCGSVDLKEVARMKAPYCCLAGGMVLWCRTSRACAVRVPVFVRRQKILQLGRQRNSIPDSPTSSKRREKGDFLNGHLDNRLIFRLLLITSREQIDFVLIVFCVLVAVCFHFHIYHTMPYM